MAEEFAGPTGVLFAIRSVTARSIKPYSAVTRESEFLLGPNSEFLVTDVATRDQRLVVSLMEMRHEVTCH